MILNRFIVVSSTGGPVVIDRDRALRAFFAQIYSAQAVARLLNANPARVEAFYWHTTEGALSE